jgi:hypothetical protein
MTTSVTTVRVPRRLQTLAATAMLLEKLERTPRSASAGQYEAVVAQLHGLLDAAEHDDESAAALPKLLQALPALAELHENRHYAEAGLCRSPLEAAVEAELETRDLLARLRPPAA